VAEAVEEPPAPGEPAEAEADKRDVTTSPEA
jgi:hypothetical protein